MKNYLLLLLVFLTLSCVENEEVRFTKSNVTPELISGNEKFAEIIQLNSHFTNGLATYLNSLDKTNRNTVIEGLEDGEIQLVDLYMKIGFNSRAEFTDWQNMRNNLVISFSNEFDSFKEFGKAELLDIFIRSEVILREEYSKVKNKSAKPDYCYQALTNCFGSANAVLALETTACVASLAVPVVGPVLGVACEAAAITHHYYSTSQCNNDYGQCSGLSF
jgi:hypothetical protein